ncbi:MAG: DUF4038 domain-containing protein [Chlorobi bacterium]|nr:DUF4038 domain-containing protein [Chlorobiota bacterium]
MKRLSVIWFLTLIVVTVNGQWLHVSPDSRRLVKDDGSVFFYMADTGWELFHRCTKDETEMYLKDRKAKGFNVIQAVVLAELDGLNTPNAEGKTPLINNDPLRPNEAYFKHVDWVIRKAEELGMYIAVLPTWGDKWNERWGTGPVIFDTPEKAGRYGKWIGKRYKDQPNIIWILGGDRNPEKPGHMDIIRAMAEGIRGGDQGRHLISYHPSGSKSSSQWFHNDSWLDFNMAQTGHMERNHPVYDLTGHDYRLEPVKPCLDGEPQYEDLPVGFTDKNERFIAYDARQAAYWSVLAGALGHTYGNNNIWQMWAPGRKPVIDARIPWYNAIHQPGSLQMGYMRRLFESRPFLEMVPDQDILANVYGQDKRTIRAARGTDSSFVIVYSSFGKPVHLRLGMLAADTLNGYWYNPREGKSIKIHDFTNPRNVKAFVPPSSGDRTDWVLVLDDKHKDYPDPAYNLIVRKFIRPRQNTTKHLVLYTAVEMFK